ncbi:hypothetical protein F3Y22_tig00112490pilonHSYRG00020 [Hibiscus syriacus]|uniref:Uncharacterized protein n=1 Tax=Hibiscus syriacus TaxID=106335 RepID=A0A6A2XI10_HIBSY|nr:hypothetical protein F3Y22_tig00112490pilonHSYRG00020 [Hibiscus syriacus]
MDETFTFGDGFLGPMKTTVDDWDRSECLGIISDGTCWCDAGLEKGKPSSAGSITGPVRVGSELQLGLVTGSDCWIKLVAEWVYLLVILGFGIGSWGAASPIYFRYFRHFMAVVEACGFSGGLLLLWRDEVQIEILNLSNQFLHTWVRYMNLAFPTYITAIYRERVVLLVELERAVASPISCLIMGYWILASKDPPTPGLVVLFFINYRCLVNADCLNKWSRGCIRSGFCSSGKHSEFKPLLKESWHSHSRYVTMSSKSFFQDFLSSGEGGYTYNIRDHFPQLDHLELQSLTLPVSNTEVHQVVFDMQSGKALGGSFVRRKRGNKGWMTFKYDLEKAYDRLE